MSSQNSQHSSLSFFDDIFFGNDTSAPVEQHDDLTTSEPEKKGYNTRGKAKVAEHSEPENNAANTEQRLEDNRPLLESLDNIFDDIYASFEEENFNFDSLLDDDVQRPDPPPDIQITSINDTPDLPTVTETDDLLSDIEVTTSNQQKSSEPKEPIDNNTAAQPKRHSLRKRNDLQLHPYSVERANYMSLVRTDSRSRTARDRMHAYIDSPQYTQNQEQENDDDPDFVPGQLSIPTQSDSIVQETQESPLDSNVLYLPKRRSKPSSLPLSRARNQGKNNTTNTTTPATTTSITTSTSTSTSTNTTNAARNKDGKTKPIIQSLFNEEESTSTSSHYLQTDPISSLPAPINRKGKHRIIHTYKRRKATKTPKNLIDQSNVFDFDPNPRVPYNPDDEDEDDDVESNLDINQDTTNQISDDNDDEEEEEIPHLPKKWPHKRKLIISDSDDDDGDDDSVIISTRRNGPVRTKQKKSLLEPNSVALYEDMVASSTQAQEPPRRRYHRQRPDDDVVPIVQDENELGMRENQRVRLNDITTNNRMLKGILPYSFSNAYRSELQEEQQWNQTRKNNSVRQKRVEKEKQPTVEPLRLATDIFSDEEDYKNNENTTSQLQQDHSISSVYTQSLTPDTCFEAVEDNRMTNHFIRGPTRTQTPSRSSKKASMTKESNRVSSHNHQKSKSTGQTSQRRRRHKIRKTTDDIYIRPSRHYWNDETIDRMFIRQGNQNQHHRQRMVSQDDISVGPSFKPTTTWHKTKITWIHHIEEYLRSEKIDHRSSNHAIRALKEREKKRLSTTQHAHHHPQQQQQQHQQRKEPQNITVASVLERVGDLVDADIRTTVGLSNTVYLHHRLLPSLLSEARNQQKYFLRFNSLLQHPIIHNTRLSWQDVVPAQQKMIRGWFWKAFCDITNTFQAQELTTIDPTFYIFVSVCIGRWIPSLKGDTEMAMIKIFNTETRIFVSQICQFITQNMASSPFIPWKVVIEAMLFALDWKCRLFNLGADEAIWPLTELTSNLIQLLVEIGPERLTMESASYVSEAWICLLQIMSISTESERYRFDEHLFLSQLEKWVDVKASKETWSKSYKTQAMKQWAIAFKYIFDNYML